MSAARRAASLLAAITAGTGSALAGASAEATDLSEDEERGVVRMARSTWDTGWFQAEIYRQLIEALGYTVESITTMEVAEFYSGAAEGSVDLWANGWFPLHNTLIGELGVADQLDVVGNQVEGGGVQGYIIDRATQEELGVDDLSDLSDPSIAQHFDADGDGRADLIGCTIGWTCADVVDGHLADLGLTDMVDHIQGDYAPLFDDAIERVEAGESVLLYAWTPNWTVGELVPGEDVVWIGPDWPVDDIRAVGGAEFLADNPVIRRLLEVVEIPSEDISQQNAQMRGGEGAPEDLRRHASEWITENETEVTRWLTTADPGRTPADVGEILPGGDGTVAANMGQSVVVSSRTLSPFVMYEDGDYTGFSIELWARIAERLGLEYEIENVNSLAKQIDDVQRGTADVALGGLDITSARANAMALSQPTVQSGLQIMVNDDSGGGLAGTLGRVVTSRLASWIAWFVGIFGVIVLIVGHVIWLLERNRNDDIPPSYPRGIAESLWWAVVAITPFGAGNNTPTRNIGRVFAVAWILAGYFLLAYFTASITSTMAVDEIRGEIGGPEDLAGHRIGTVSGTPGAEQLAGMGISPVLYDTLDETYTALDNGDIDAVVYDAPVLQHHAARSGAGGVAVVGPVFNEFSYGIGMAYDSALQAEIDVALLEMVESGAYDTIYEQWFGEPPP